MLFIVVGVLGAIILYAMCATDFFALILGNTVKGPAALPKKKISKVSQRLLNLNKELPVEHQISNIEYALEALDVKYDIRLVNNHFYDYDGFTWFCYCKRWRKPDCTMPEYSTLKEELDGIKADLATRDRALRIAGVQDGLDLFQSIMKSIREERELIQEVTKEIS